MDLNIIWNPLVRRDFEGFRKLALEINDPKVREKTLLKAGGLIDALMGELVRVGYFSGPENLNYAINKYKTSIEDGLELDLRKKLLDEVSTFTQYFEDCSALTYLPFILGDVDRGIVSTATLGYVSVAIIEEGADPILIPRHVVQMIEEKRPANRGAVFGGLLSTGDPRVCLGLLWDLRHLLSEDEINEACLCHTGFIGQGAVDFYLSWLEEIVHEGRDSLFGKLASGLALLRRNTKTESVFTGVRPFPYTSVQSDELAAILKPIPIDDFTRQMALRMLQLSNQELEPKVMPDVLRIWGICTQPDAKGILISDDLIERCLELIDESRNTEPMDTDALINLIDTSIELTGDFTLATKIGDEISMRGTPGIWEFLFARGNAAITIQSCDGPNGATWGQIIALPLYCNKETTDGQILEACGKIPALPDGKAFNFCPVILRWSNLRKISSTRILHSLLQRWRSAEDKQFLEAEITSYADFTREDDSFDEVVFQSNQISKLRFLVGYRFGTEDLPDYPQEQRVAWSSQATELLQSASGDKNIGVRSPKPLADALYSAQNIMTELNARAAVFSAERYHSPVAQDKLGIRLAAYGNLFSGQAECLEVTAYDFKTGDTIVRREIPIVFPSNRLHWKQELDDLRINLEVSGIPYVAVAPILQSIYVNELTFEKTKCIKVTLGAPASSDISVKDGLPFENISENPQDKQRWDAEGKQVHVDAETIKIACADHLGLDVETVFSSGEFALSKGRWFPTVLVFLRDAKNKDGSPIDWPLNGALVDAAVKTSAVKCGRRWAISACGGMPTVTEEVDVELVYKLALDGELAAQVQLAHILYRGERVERHLSNALAWFRRAAAQGHSKSQEMVANMLEEGLGCAKNNVEALHWFRLAAENGEINSQIKLAAIYEAGESVPQDYEEAEKWYRLAADQGSAEAQFSLGWLLYSGNGVPRNLAEAAEYFERAALLGNASAQYNIAAMYGHGEHTVVDRVRAYAWLRLAAEQEYDRADTGLEEVCSRMSASELAQGKKLSKELSVIIKSQQK